MRRLVACGAILVAAAAAGCGEDKPSAQKTGGRPLHLINSGIHKGRHWRVQAHVCENGDICLVHDDQVLQSGGARIDFDSPLDKSVIGIADFPAEALRPGSKRSWTVEVGIASPGIREVVVQTHGDKLGVSARRVRGLPGRFFTYVVPQGTAGGDEQRFVRRGSVLFIIRTLAR